MSRTRRFLDLEVAQEVKRKPQSSTSNDNQGRHLGGEENFPPELWEENEELFYIPVLSDTAEKVQKM